MAKNILYANWLFLTNQKLLVMGEFNMFNTFPNFANHYDELIYNSHTPTARDFAMVHASKQG